MSQARRPVLLSAPIHKYRDVFRLVGRTPLSARDAFVPSKSARGPTAVQGDRPTSAVQALNSSSYLGIGVLSRDVFQALVAGFDHAGGRQQANHTDPGEHQEH